MKNKLKQGNGGLLAGAIICTNMCILIIMFLALIERSFSTKEIQNAVTVASRGIILCNTKSDAEKTASEMIKENISSSNITNIKVRINDKTSNQWKSEDLIEVRVTANINTVFPAFSNTYTYSMCVMLEKEEIFSYHLIDNTPESIIVQYLKDNFSFTEAGIAAVVSNIYLQNQLKESNIRQSGELLNQDGPRKMLMDMIAKDQSLDAASLFFQLQYFKTELDGYNYFENTQFYYSFNGSLIKLENARTKDEAKDCAKYLFENYVYSFTPLPKNKAELEHQLEDYVAYFYEHGNLTSLNP